MYSEAKDEEIGLDRPVREHVVGLGEHLGGHVLTAASMCVTAANDMVPHHLDLVSFG